MMHIDEGNLRVIIRDEMASVLDKSIKNGLGTKVREICHEVVHSRLGNFETIIDERQKKNVELLQWKVIALCAAAGIGGGGIISTVLNVLATKH